MLDADIASCFDEIDRQALVAQIERRSWNFGGNVPAG
jgi:hypothetical protein